MKLQEKDIYSKYDYTFCLKQSHQMSEKPIMHMVHTHEST